MPFYRFSTALFLVCTIAAQDQPNLVGKSLEELMEIPIESVVTASRYRQRVTEAPASVTVVTSEEIRRYGWRTLADVLQSVRGFHISYDRFYHYIGVRGFSRPGDFNARVLVLIDGHRVNENVYEGAYLEDGFPVSMDLVERIEIIRGPGSSLYGTNALSNMALLDPALAVQTPGRGHAKVEEHAPDGRMRRLERAEHAVNAGA